jgi:hypothetical protein
MASTMKDFADSATRFMNTSLDNMKHFIDRASDEVAKADVVGANRRIADHVIEGAKETVCRVSDAAGKADAVNLVLHLATGTIETARETVRVASEESQRINLVETGSKVTQEGLDLLRRQLELSFDTGREMGSVMNRMLPFRVAPSKETAARPGVITRVEIESDKGTIKTEPVGAHR